ncbi:MAG: cutinase family protein [Candidatus Saccharibacteria bacterium]|nr:cutinase family protein [Candidatus Saccharibacteria bacterium]
MLKKLRQKMWVKNIKITLSLWFLAILFMVNSLMPVTGFHQNVGAASCPDVKIIFARGSGEERWMSQNYLTFKNELTEKFKLISLTYEFEDLDYPAISVANPLTLLTTFVSGGEAYEFGESILKGLAELKKEVGGSACHKTRYVLAGYSQGAMLVSKALGFLNPERIIYAATFGDPKLYLPEGEGLIPPACRGVNLSNYRIYVPDCRAYSGMLGGYNPYQSPDYINKLGTWCNKADFFCSSHLSMKDHTSYVSDGLYADASKVIFDKITKAFKISNNYVSLHDTAILIDSTGSMSGLIDDYKAEVLSLAKKTLEAGGRVALYDYRDLDDPYEVYEHCNFETCTLDSFEKRLFEIEADGGGDTPESLLSASFKMMKKLNWKYGSTKSVVVLTDADYHEPDLDGVSFADVVNLSKSIDPVNFYIITPEETMVYYSDLADATGGKVVNSASDLGILTGEIMARYDSLPRVEEDFDDAVLPKISDLLVEYDSDSVKVNFKNTGTFALVILNDVILGMTEEQEITITDVNFSSENSLRLVPLGENVRGNGVDVKLTAGAGMGSLNLDIELPTSAIPKAPNAGRR